MSVKDATHALRGGVYSCPSTSSDQEAASSSSNTSGRTRTILPSSTWTRIGPPLVQFTKLCSAILAPLSPSWAVYVQCGGDYAIGAPFRNAISVVANPCRNE